MANAKTAVSASVKKVQGLTLPQIWSKFEFPLLKDGKRSATKIVGAAKLGKDLVQVLIAQRREDLPNQSALAPVADALGLDQGDIESTPLVKFLYRMKSDVALDKGIIDSKGKVSLTDDDGNDFTLPVDLIVQYATSRFYDDQEPIRPGQDSEERMVVKADDGKWESLYQNVLPVPAGKSVPAPHQGIELRRKGELVTDEEYRASIAEYYGVEPLD